MSEETPNITDELSQESDNLNQEPVKADNSTNDSKPDAEKSAGSEDKEPKNEIPDTFLKKFFGEEEKLNELSERDLKIAKSAYNAEKMALEKAQELGNLKKQQEIKQVEEKQTSIVTASKELQQTYQAAIETIENLRQKEIQECKQAKNSQQLNQDQYDYIVAEINKKYAKLEFDCEKEFNLRAKDHQNKQQEFHKEQNLKLFQEIESKNTEKLKLDEYKTAYDGYKEFFDYPEDVEKFVFPMVDKVIKAYETRKTREASLNEDINDKTKKLTSINNLSSKPSSGNVKLKPTYDDVMSMSPEDLKRWALK